MSSPAATASGHRRRSRDWVDMDDAVAAPEPGDAPAGFQRVVMPMLVDGEIRFDLYDMPVYNYDLDGVLARFGPRHHLDPASHGRRKRARAPAYSDDAIRGLVREARAGDAGMPEECAVCLQDFDADAKETLRVMPSCSHAFHPDCIFTWLRVKPLCPMCRRALPLPTQQQQQDQAFGDEDYFEDEDDTDEDSDDTDEDSDDTDEDSDEDGTEQDSAPVVPDPEEP